MTFKGVALVTKHGHVPPDSILQDMLLHNQSCFGLAMTAKLEGKPIVSLIRLPTAKLGDNQLAKLKGTMEKYKDQRVLLYTGSFPEGFNNDDIQPFPLLFNEVSGGRPTLVGCLVGEFEGAGTDGHSEQWSDFNQYLTPKLLPIYEAVGYDIAKFMAKLKEAPIRKELEGYFDKATLTLFSSDDTCMTLGKEGYEGSQFDWGWVSPLHFEEKAAEEIKAAPKTDLENEFGIEEVPATPAVTEPPVVPAGKSQIGSKPVIASTVPLSGKKADGPVTETEMRSPEKTLSNKKKKAWYNQHIGKVPENWQECPLVPVKVTKSYKTLEEAGEALKGGTSSPEVVKAKDTDTHVVGKEKDNTKVPVGTGPQPEMHTVSPLIPSAAEHKKFLDEFMKDMTVSKVDRNNETIFDPALLPSLEQDKPTFAELAKLPNIESSYTWSPERRLKMIKEYPEMAASYIFDLICNDVEGARTIQRLNKQITALKAGTAPKDVEEVVHERPRQPATGQGGKPKVSKYAA